MGIPKFNRFITNRYPSVQEQIKDGSVIEIDNFFVDMNGIIHICTHPEEEGISEENYTAKDAYENIFNFLDVLFDIVKPKKLLFLAVDGVAPRAKLNQQRARRFRSAMKRELWKTQDPNMQLPPFSRYDANCVTPGTKFMARLQKYLEYFISRRISTSPLWKNCKVILSGSQVPGEGEHKIMEYIRNMKLGPDYDPYERHCLYGLDADLIILGLCTKEKNVSILREGALASGKAIRLVCPEKGNFSLIHLSLLREYLDMEFKDVKMNIKFQYNLEKIIDDWVLIGFLVGNDYLPHLADLHIEKGALQLLYRTYIETLPELSGYINENGTLNFKRFRVFIRKLTRNIRKDFKVQNHSYFHGEKKLSKQTKKNPSLLYIKFRKQYYRDKLNFTRKNLSRQSRNLAREYVQGLQWILHYYYRGCESWSWFYPEHYGPLSASIVEIASIKFDFKLGKPFLPYEQLLAVLPPTSKTLLPKCYRKLMTAAESPIKKYYPRTFQIDLNGRRNDWEAVVLLPMINEEELLEAMNPCNSNLKTWQTENNTHRDMLVYSYSANLQSRVSPPRYFPVFRQNHATVESVPVGLNPVQTPRLVYTLRYRVNRNTYFPGFPTFRNINQESEKIFWEIQLPNHNIKIEKVIVSITENDDVWNSESAMKLLGKNVYVNWPNLSVARIVEVEDATNRYSENGETLDKHSLGEQAVHNWTLARSSLHNNFLERGIEIGTTKVIVHVKHPKGIRKYFSPGGVFLNGIVWSEKIEPFPLQTIVKNPHIFRPHRTEPVLVGEMFPPKTDVISLEYSTYGCKGRIKKRRNNPENTGLPVQLQIVDDYQINRELARNGEPRYYLASEVGIKLDISSAIVEKIAGNILINLEPEDSGTTEQSALNIGLQIKNSESNEKVPGYTKQEENWMYSDKAVTLMKEYIEKFPKVFNFLLAQSTEETSFTKSDFIPGYNDIKDFEQVIEWLKDSECSGIERVSCDSEIVEEELIESLQTMLDIVPCKVKSRQLVYMDPEDLFTNNLIIGDIAPVVTSRYELFDLIVCVSKTGIVPFGARGYIVGIINTGNGEEMYDILFDRSYADGLNFNSPDIRKLRMSQAHFINITRGKMDIAVRNGHVDTNFVESDRQIVQSKIARICSMLAKKLKINDLMMKLMMRFNRPEKEESSAVSNSSLQRVQEKIWASYRSRLYNPCILPSPSLQLFRMHGDGSSHYHQYTLRSIQNNDSKSNTQDSNPNSINEFEITELRQDSTETNNKSFGRRIFSIFRNLFPVKRPSFRPGVHVYPSLQDSRNVMADNDQPGTSHQLDETTAHNCMPEQDFFINFEQFLQTVVRHKEQKGKAPEELVHASLSAREPHPGNPSSLQQQEN